MNKKTKIILAAALGVVLVAVTVVCLILFLKPAVTPAPATTLVPSPTDIGRILMTNETLFEEDFASTYSGSVPKDWEKARPFTFLNNAKDSTALTFTGSNKNHCAVATLQNGNYLSISASGGEHVLALPDFKAKEYVFSMDFSFTSFKNPLGLAVDLPSDLLKATSAIIFYLESADPNPDDEDTTAVPCVKVVNQSTDGKTISTEQLLFAPVTDFAPELVYSNNISSDKVLNLSVYRYESQYYFYIQNHIVACVKSGNPDNSRLGIFSNTDGKEVKIFGVKASTLISAEGCANELYEAALSYSEDFSSATDGQLPKKWTAFTGKWLPSGLKTAASVSGGALKINSANGESATLFPTLDDRNMLISAEITLDSADGEVGLVYGIGDRLQNATDTSFAGLSLAEGKFLFYNLSDTKKSDVKSYDITSVFENGFKAGDTVTVSVYAYKGYSYLYVNDKFISWNTMPLSGVKKQHCGIYANKNSGITVKKVTASNLVLKGETDIVGIIDATITPTENTVSLVVSGNLSIKNPLYSGTVSGKYSEDSGLKFGVMALPCDTKTPVSVTADSKDVLVSKTTIDSEKSSTLAFTATLPEIKTEDLNRYMTVRSYISVTRDGNTTYFYGEPTVYNPPALASNLYLTANKTTKDKLDAVFVNCDKYIGKYEKTLTFALFSDFHYKQGMYSTSVADMNAIMSRANKAGASFVLTAGDMCNDFLGSPEILNAFLKNQYNLPVYNVYGNHELECGNTMEYVTPLLTNDKNVVWGTEDGKIGDGSIAYYYFDYGGFRVVCVDTNYSYNPELGQWEHNYTGSYGPPTGNTKANSLGPTQLTWLEETLFDAARNGTPCIIIGHDSFAGKFRSTSPDASAVKEIFSRVNAYRKGTVLMSINGHIHTDNTAVVDGVLYLDMNTTRNCEWQGTGTEHYTANHTFDYVEYDSDGNAISTTKKSLGELSMGKNTWFSEDPLSAIVTISQYGTITVEGTESRWIYGIDPNSPHKDTVPKVSSGKWTLMK